LQSSHLRTWSTDIKKYLSSNNRNKVVKQ
jgi:hypothetical protein